MDNVTDGQTVRTEDIVVREGDGGLIVIYIPTDPPTYIHLDHGAADRICTALDQLLTDRSLRQHGSLISKAAQLPDQVERAELLADAPPPSAADMSEGELILGRRVPRGDEVAAARELVANRPCTCTIDACGLRMCARCVALRR